MDIVKGSVNIKNAYDNANDMLKISSMQKKFRDSFSNSMPDATKWDVVKDPSMTWDTATAGLLKLNLGTTINAVTTMTTKDVFTCPVRVMFGFMVPTKQANQEFYLELVSVNPTTLVPDEKAIAAWKLDNTLSNQTTAYYQVANNGTPRLTSSACTINSWASLNIAEIELFSDECWFHSRQMDSVNGRNNSYVRHQQIPDPNVLYKIRIRCVNLSTAPAAANTFQSQYVVINDYAELTAEITAGRGNMALGQALGVSVLNTSVPVISTIAHDGAGSSANPFKVGVTAVNTNPAAVSATLDVANLIGTMIGVPIFRPYSIPEADWQYSAPKGGLVNSTTALVMREAAGANIRNYITSIDIFAETLTTATELEIRENDLTCASQTIASNTLTTSATHYLSIGDEVIFTASTVTGITANVTYFVLTVPSATTLTLSATRGGSVLAISGTSVTATFHKVLYMTKIGTTGGRHNIRLATPIKGSTNCALLYQTTTASGAGAIYLNAEGYFAP